MATAVLSTAVENAVVMDLVTPRLAISENETVVVSHDHEAWQMGHLSRDYESVVYAVLHSS